MDIHAEESLARTLGTAGLALGMFGTVIFWVFPFGPMSSAAGLVLAVIGLARMPYDRLARLGVFTAAVGLGAGLLTGWGTYVRLLGF